MVAHLAAKYEPLADIFAAEYGANPGIKHRRNIRRAIEGHPLGAPDFVLSRG